MTAAAKAGEKGEGEAAVTYAPVEVTAWGETPRGSAIVFAIPTKIAIAPLEVAGGSPAALIGRGYLAKSDDEERVLRFARTFSQ